MMKYNKYLSVFILLTCLMVLFVSGCRRNKVLVSQVLQETIVSQITQGKYTFYVLPTSDSITKYIQNKYYSDEKYADGMSLSGSEEVSTWNEILEDIDNLNVIYVTVGSETKPKFKDTTCSFYDVVVDDVLYGNLKKGDTVTLKQWGSVLQSGMWSGYDTNCEPYKAGDKLLLFAKKGYIECPKGSLYPDGYRIDYYSIVQGQQGFVDEIDGETYLVYRFDHFDGERGCLAEELMDRDLIKDNKDFFKTQIEVKIKDSDEIFQREIPVVKQEVMQQFLAYLNDYATGKWKKISHDE